MAKKKSVRTRTRTVIKKVRARAKKKNTMEKLFAKAMTAAAYGAVRPMIAQRISPLVQNIPAGQYADEVGMIIVTSLGTKFGKGFVKDVANAGFMIESAFLGQQVGSNLLQNNTIKQNNTRTL